MTEQTIFVTRISDRRNFTQNVAISSSRLLDREMIPELFIDTRYDGAEVVDKVITRNFFPSNGHYELYEDRDGKAHLIE